MYPICSERTRGEHAKVKALIDARSGTAAANRRFSGPERENSMAKAASKSGGAKKSASTSKSSGSKSSSSKSSSAKKK